MFDRQRVFAIRCISVPMAWSLALLLGGPSAAAAAEACANVLPPLQDTYGADGPHALQQASVANPAFPRREVQVFLPQGLVGKAPVIFLAHGYGPGRWSFYGDLIRHWSSRGYAVVFSSYPLLLASHAQRYDSLWQGDLAAARQFAERLDLSRVGFVGHSYGGGAVPALAYRGIIEQGWGTRGAFLVELAPWYVLQTTPSQWQQWPTQVLQLLEVYSDDTINDPRMAIDLYAHSGIKRQWYFEVLGGQAGCGDSADHSTPARSQALRLKQYAVFAPLDALAAAAFEGDPAALSALTQMGQRRPLQRQTAPRPARPESAYRFAWHSADNPRLSVVDK